ncbi:MAG: hypothetical protein ACRDHM_08030, partial [Actinomycetota bacterium]
LVLTIIAALMLLLSGLLAVPVLVGILDARGALGIAVLIFGIVFLIVLGQWLSKDDEEWIVKFLTETVMEGEKDIN